MERLLMAGTSERLRFAGRGEACLLATAEH